MNLSFFIQLHHLSWFNLGFISEFHLKPTSSAKVQANSVLLAGCIPHCLPAMQCGPERKQEIYELFKYLPTFIFYAKVLF